MGANQLVVLNVYDMVSAAPGAACALPAPGGVPRGGGGDAVVF